MREEGERETDRVKKKQKKGEIILSTNGFVVDE